MKNLKTVHLFLFILLGWNVPAYAVDIKINLPDPLDPLGLKAKPKPTTERKHQYRYYPSGDVYFDPVRSLYYFLSANQWKVSAKLPDPLKIHLQNPVIIDMDSDKPYEHHKEHRTKYKHKHKHEYEYEHESEYKHKHKHKKHKKHKHKKHKHKHEKHKH